MMMENKHQKEQTFKNIAVAGIDEKRFDITIINGCFSSIAESVALPPQQGEDLWICPGVIDLHTHLAWTDFDYADQLKRDEREVEALQAQAFEATLCTGVTTVRDAGGLLPNVARYINRHYSQPLRVYACGDMLGAEDAKGVGHLERRVNEIVNTGASWIKIFATGGLGSPTETVLEPLFSREEFFAVVCSAHACNKKVMVHTWGGPTLDWAIDAGADSVEHGVYLTEAQANRLAQARISLIPTAAIYRIAADSSGLLSLDKEICERAARAAEAHPKAIQNAIRTGVRMGFGTDFATPALHGRNLEELDALMDCGLTRKEAWQSATQIAAEILGYGNRLGRIEKNFASDAIIFNADPYKLQNAKALRKSIVSVVTGAI